MARRAAHRSAIAARDIALAAGHRRIAISLLVGTLNSAAAFSIAACSSRASTSPSQTALLAIFQLVGFGIFGLFFAIDKYRPQLWRPITGSAT